MISEEVICLLLDFFVGGWGGGVHIWGEYCYRELINKITKRRF